MEERVEIPLADVEEFIRGLVAAGFYSREEVETNTLDYFSDEIEAEAIRHDVVDLTRKAIGKHHSEQASWPSVTDCDRLNDAFAELEGRGITSRQNFSCCGTCGAAEIADLIYDAIEAGEKIRGYTFYHQQDTEAAVEGYGICLSYGSVEEGEKAALDIAHEVTTVLHKHDLNPTWDGSWNKRIEVPLDWKRRT